MWQNINRIVIAVIFSLICWNHLEVMAETKKFTVVIDAGHGGKDIGATDNGVMEKNINLKVAKELESLIKKKLKNTKVVMTRDADRYLTLQERADVANKAQGDLFISIHTNSVDKRNRHRKSIAGSSVYTLGLHKDENNLEVARRENSVIELETDFEQKYSGFDPQRDESYIIFEMAQKKNLSQSIKFAESVEKELVNAGRQDRGVHQAGFWVLWATSMPSVLIELDFICNPESAKYISGDKGAKELAEAIFNAVKRYEENWNKTLTPSPVQNSTHTYVEDSESNLEETYTLVADDGVAVARSRSHKIITPANKGSINGGVKESPGKSDARRRRSSRSRELSNNQSFEKDNLSVPVKDTYSAPSSLIEEEELIAMAPTVDKVSQKTKKTNKKKQKETGKKENSAEKKRRQDAHNAKVSKLVTVYKIQVLASADLLSQNNSRFCGLSPITTYKENNLYKYYYGETTDRSELESVLADVRKKIPDAFIVSSQKSVQENK